MGFRPYRYLRNGSSGVEEMVRAEQVSRIGLGAGPLLFILTVSLPVEGLTPEAKAVLASAAWMGAWWVTEAAPIYVTALLPLIVFPISGASTLPEVSSSYSDRILFLFLSGFMLGAAIERSGLHERFALHAIRIFGTSPRRIVGGFMAATGMLSAWLSNTAGAALLIPVAASLGTSLGINPLVTMVAVGLATSYSFILPAGTPPNAMAIASGYVTTRQMARAGFILDLIGVGIVSLLTLLLVPAVWG